MLGNNGKARSKYDYGEIYQYLCLEELSKKISK